MSNDQVNDPSNESKNKIIIRAHFTSEHTHEFEYIKQNLDQAFPSLKDSYIITKTNLPTSVYVCKTLNIAKLDGNQISNLLSNVLFVLLVIIMTGIRPDNSGFLDSIVPNWLKTVLFERKIYVFIALAFLKFTGVLLLGEGIFTFSVNGHQIFQIDRQSQEIPSMDYLIKAVSEITKLKPLPIHHPSKQNKKTQ